MIREGIELGSLKGLAQNKTSGWFIMLLFLCPFRVLLLASFLFGIFCANWIQATTQDCPKHNDLESRRNAISVLDFPPPGTKPDLFRCWVSRGLSTFSRERRYARSAGKSWLVSDGSTERYPHRKKKGDQFCCKTWFARKRRHPRNSWVLMLSSSGVIQMGPIFWGSNLTLKSMVISMNFPQRWCIVWVIVWEWPL